ncbi:hypothetical protein TELCIR_04426 [Teladorsagia circumcincta]|uniref:Uncharacterized protein n=1 Tax=Teladorsagia circumcincta TaxID=45464 RepID=A0A2G9UVQ7_TELCI|nr:hypothetical protein TELCIR_04426 [Teladorsagia circumcincta]
MRSELSILIVCFLVNNELNATSSLLPVRERREAEARIRSRRSRDDNRERNCQSLNTSWFECFSQDIFECTKISKRIDILYYNKCIAVVSLWDEWGHSKNLDRSKCIISIDRRYLNCSTTRSTVPQPRPSILSTPTSTEQPNPHRPGTAHEEASKSVSHKTTRTTATAFSTIVEQTTSSARSTETSEDLSTPSVRTQPTTLHINFTVTKKTETSDHISGSTQSIRTLATVSSTQFSTLSTSVSKKDQTSNGFTSPMEEMTTEMPPSSDFTSQRLSCAWEATYLLTVPPQEERQDNRSSSFGTSTFSVANSTRPNVHKITVPSTETSAVPSTFSSFTLFYGTTTNDEPTSSGTRTGRNPERQHECHSVDSKGLHKVCGDKVDCPEIPWCVQLYSHKKCIYINCVCEDWEYCRNLGESCATPSITICYLPCPTSQRTTLPRPAPQHQPTTPPLSNRISTEPPSKPRDAETSGSVSYRSGYRGHNTTATQISLRRKVSPFPSSVNQTESTAGRAKTSEGPPTSSVVSTSSKPTYATTGEKVAYKSSVTKHNTTTIITTTREKISPFHSSVNQKESSAGPAKTSEGLSTPSSAVSTPKKPSYGTTGESVAYKSSVTRHNTTTIIITTREKTSPFHSSVDQTESTARRAKTSEGLSTPSSVVSTPKIPSYGTTGESVSYKSNLTRHNTTSTQMSPRIKVSPFPSSVKTTESTAGPAKKSEGLSTPSSVVSTPSKLLYATTGKSAAYKSSVTRHNTTTIIMTTRERTSPFHSSVSQTESIAGPAKKSEGLPTTFSAVSTRPSFSYGKITGSKETETSEYISESTETVHTLSIARSTLRPSSVGVAEEEQRSTGSSVSRKLLTLMTSRATSMKQEPTSSSQPSSDTTLKEGAYYHTIPAQNSKTTRTTNAAITGKQSANWSTVQKRSFPSQQKTSGKGDRVRVSGSRRRTTAALPSSTIFTISSSWISSLGIEPSLTTKPLSKKNTSTSTSFSPTTPPPMTKRVATSTLSAGHESPESLSSARKGVVNSSSAEVSSREPSHLTVINKIKSTSEDYATLEHETSSSPNSTHVGSEAFAATETFSTLETKTPSFEKITTEMWPSSIVISDRSSDVSQEVDSSFVTVSASEDRQNNSLLSTGADSIPSTSHAANTTTQTPRNIAIPSSQSTTSGLTNAPSALSLFNQMTSSQAATLPRKHANTLNSSITHPHKGIAYDHSHSTATRAKHTRTLSTSKHTSTPSAAHLRTIRHFEEGLLTKSVVTSQSLVSDRSTTGRADSFVEKGPTRRSLPHWTDRKASSFRNFTRHPTAQQALTSAYNDGTASNAKTEPFPTRYVTSSNYGKKTIQLQQTTTGSFD